MKRPRRTSRGMLPVYRDVHPDRCPVELHFRCGSIVQFDLPELIVTCLDAFAEAKGQSFQKLACRAFAQQLKRLKGGDAGE